MWIPNQTNLITFVMVDSSGTEVSGLGAGFTLTISKNGAAFAASAGTKAEIGSGWYSYLSTAGEADTPGVVSVLVTGAGAVQQNLEYEVDERTPNAIEFTYTVTVSGNPEEGVEVWASTDAAGTNIVVAGLTTDAFGVARNTLTGFLPRLDPGTYYFWKQKAGLSDNDNPDTEVVS